MSQELIAALEEELLTCLRHVRQYEWTAAEEAAVLREGGEVGEAGAEVAAEQAGWAAASYEVYCCLCGSMRATLEGGRLVIHSNMG